TTVKVPTPPAPAEVDPTLWVGLAPADAQALRAALMRAQIELAQHLVYEHAGPAAATHLTRAMSELYAPAKADYASPGPRIAETAFAKAAEAAATGATSAQMRWHTDNMIRQVDKLVPPNGQWSKPATIKRLLSELSHQYGQGVQSGYVVNEAR